MRTFRRQAQIDRRSLSARLMRPAKRKRICTDNVVCPVRREIRKRPNFAAVVELSVGVRRRVVGQETRHSVGLVRRETGQKDQSEMGIKRKIYGKMFENPPPEKMTSSQALSGSFTVFPGRICVAPTAVTNPHVLYGKDEPILSGEQGRLTGKLGLKTVPFSTG